MIRFQRSNDRIWATCFGLEEEAQADSNVATARTKAFTEMVNRSGCGGANNARVVAHVHVSELMRPASEVEVRVLTQWQRNSGKQSEISIEPSPLTSGDIDTQPKTASSTSDILFLRCRMCEEPPRAVTKPTVTTCGHLFCFEYVPRRLGGIICGLTLSQVHNATRRIHVQMSRVRQPPLVVLSI